jgi:hypothetical protein
MQGVSDLLLENGLGLATETSLLAVVTTLALSAQRGLGEQGKDGSGLCTQTLEIYKPQG